MTDRDLAAALASIVELERRVKAHLAGSPEPGECTAAVLVGRQAACLRGPLEKWITARAVLAEQRRQIAAT